MTIKHSDQHWVRPTGEDEKSADEASLPASAGQGKSLETLVAEAQEIISSRVDPMMREALRDNPEQLAEWDALMQQCAEAAAADEREAEEEKEQLLAPPHQRGVIGDHQLLAADEDRGLHEVEAQILRLSDRGFDEQTIVRDDVILDAHEHRIARLWRLRNSSE